MAHHTDAEVNNMDKVYTCVHFLTLLGSDLLSMSSRPLLQGYIMSCQPRVTVTSYFVYNVIRDSPFTGKD